MTKDEVLNTLIQNFKDLNAVDKNLSDVEIAQIKLPDIDLFKHEMARDKDGKKEFTFKQIMKDLKELYDGEEPVLSPHDPTIFDRGITIDAFASEIFDDN